MSVSGVFGAIMALLLVIPGPASLLGSQTSTNKPESGNGAINQLIYSISHQKSDHADLVARLTGADMDTCSRWTVCGTDLGIPFLQTDGSTGFLFGDTFRQASPEVLDSVNFWRSPVMLLSDTNPSQGNRIVFNDAFGVHGDGLAPSVIPDSHRRPGEISPIPNDGISFPETGDQIISYMSVEDWSNPWKSKFSGLAWKPAGSDTFKRMGPVWVNNGTNTDPFQMVSMQRDGNWVYLISVQSGRQYGPMVLQRVPWDQMLNHEAYKCWNGHEWGAKCKPIIEGGIGEPSLRKLKFGTWAMSYLRLDDLSIVTRYASNPVGPWSEPKVQITIEELPNLYGGFIDPNSTSNDLTMLVSSWQHDQYGNTTRYDVSQYHGTLW